MDTTLLKTFLEVAKRRHFRRAADSLFLTQSAVSARIKLLEETLGAELFTRKRNDIQLTPAGNRLLQHAESIVKGWERARQSVALDPDLSSLLSIGCLFDLWTILVSEWTQLFRNEFEDIALQIDILATDALLNRLSLGMLDIAFMFDPPQTANLETMQIAEVPLILVNTSPDQNVNMAMSNLYVMVDWGSSFGILHAEKFPDMNAPAFRTNSGSVALNMILENGGAAYLPEQVSRKYIELGKLFQVEDAPVINRLAYIAYRPEMTESDSMIKAMRTIKLLTAI